MEETSGPKALKVICLIFLTLFHNSIDIIKGVRIKTRLGQLFMKNELRVSFIRKPD